MDNLQSEFDAAWTAFQRLDTLRLLPDTLESEWMRGRDSYLAILVPVTETSVVAHLSEAVHGIENIPGVEPYPEEYWHITIKGIGFEANTPTNSDDFGQADIADLSAAARAIFAEQPAFDVRIGPLNAFPEVVFAEVRDSMAVRELNRRLIEAMPGIVRYPYDGEAFLPHLSVARITSNEGLPALKETIGRLRQAQPGPTLRIAEVQLVRAHLSERAPVLEPIESFALA